MKLMISLSLDENEQDEAVTIIDQDGSEKTLHAEGGQCTIELIGSRHTITIDSGVHPAEPTSV